MTRPAVFRIRLTDLENRRVWVIDEDQPDRLSITNDAKNVTRRLFEQFGNYRFFYRDTMGNWDELEHDHGRFTKFTPAHELAAGERLIR